MKKLRLKKSSKNDDPKVEQTRITNETIAAHRERILAGGRRFKYPHQYVKHKLVFNALLIAAAVALLVTALVWWQLYVVQSTSDLMYRVTRVFPVPVASIDGAHIRYSDYLVQYRSQEHWLKSTSQLGIASGDGERQLDYLKTETMNKLVADRYAEKKAKELGITVSSDEVQAAVDENRSFQNGKTSQEVYDASIRDKLGFSPDEYRRMLKHAILRQKVAYAVDAQARQYAQEVTKLVTQKKSKLTFEQVVQRFKKQGIDVEFGASGLVPINNHDDGLTSATLKLKDGEIAPALKASTNGDGYYFVQRLSGDSRQVSYQFVKVPLTVFAKEVDQLKRQGKVEYYIELPEGTNPKQK